MTPIRQYIWEKCADFPRPGGWVFSNNKVFICMSKEPKVRGQKTTVIVTPAKALFEELFRMDARAEVPKHASLELIFDDVMEGMGYEKEMSLYFYLRSL